jgi:hypothetical protein
MALAVAAQAGLPVPPPPPPDAAAAAAAAPADPPGGGGVLRERASARAPTRAIFVGRALAVTGAAPAEAAASAAGAGAPSVRSLARPAFQDASVAMMLLLPPLSSAMAVVVC